MILYVMRHAEAVEGNDNLKDEWRYLTEKGREAAAKMSASLVKTAPKPRLIITSPLARAVQTAEIAAGKACRKNMVIASEKLLPGADIGELIAYVKARGDAKRIMLVGHEPQLGSLVATLLGRGDKAVALQKGACAALEVNMDKDNKAADFLWYQAPGKRRVTSFKKAFQRK